MRIARVLGLAAVFTTASCVNLEPTAVQIPADYIKFRIEPSLIGYVLTDTSTGNHLYQRWYNEITPPAGYPLAGYNCISMSPQTVAGDTTGNFVFTFVGPNQGFLIRTENGVTDSTTLGNLLWNGIGTHGTYALTSTGHLNLFWADGLRARFFDPSAIIRLSHDTIYSDITQTFRADSINVEWHIRWIFDPGC